MFMIELVIKLKKKIPEHFTHVYTAWSKYSHRQRGIKLQLSGLKRFTCTCNFQIYKKVP